MTRTSDAFVMFWDALNAELTRRGRPELNMSEAKYRWQIALEAVQEDYHRQIEEADERNRDVRRRMSGSE